MPAVVDSQPPARRRRRYSLASAMLLRHPSCRPYRRRGQATHLCWCRPRPPAYRNCRPPAPAGGERDGSCGEAARGTPSPTMVTITTSSFRPFRDYVLSAPPARKVMAALRPSSLLAATPEGGCRERSGLVRRPSAVAPLFPFRSRSHFVACSGQSCAALPRTFDRGAGSTSAAGRMGLWRCVRRGFRGGVEGGMT